MPSLHLTFQYSHIYWTTVLHAVPVKLNTCNKLSGGIASSLGNSRSLIKLHVKAMISGSICINDGIALLISNCTMTLCKNQGPFKQFLNRVYTS